ncbi:hypothetical protein [Variovorax sp. PAMC 28711]|uniref:hypothetical protein n=1 Tax=Variovorax sp. PAMC 28711 TaxID=1795631 RepID=UPI00078DA6BE|nr:hypothetical protein [Variovorax sp. PAMC 28711]AMM23199.1 hypothetical protein AX767_01515 [Variovorax sp. PAMC 28711]
MTTRDLTDQDIDGFLMAHKQRAEETRFAQLEADWTPNTVMEDFVMLAVIALIALAVPVGFVLWKVLG